MNTQDTEVKTDNIYTVQMMHMAGGFCVLAYDVGFNIFFGVTHLNLFSFSVICNSYLHLHPSGRKRDFNPRPFVREPLGIG
jgi:hypothetical protein